MGSEGWLIEDGVEHLSRMDWQLSLEWLGGTHGVSAGAGWGSCVLDLALMVYPFPDRWKEHLAHLEAGMLSLCGSISVCCSQPCPSLLSCFPRVWMWC